MKNTCTLRLLRLLITLPSLMVKKQNRGRIRKITNPVLKQAPTTATIKVRLDSRTVITIHDMSALAIWLTRYPDAKVI